MSLERAKELLTKGESTWEEAVRLGHERTLIIAIDTVSKTATVASAHALVSIAESLHEISQTLGNMDLRRME